MWAHYYLVHATQPMALFPVEFKEAAAALLLCDLGLEETDIYLENADIVYMHVISMMNYRCLKTFEQFHDGFNGRPTSCIELAAFNTDLVPLRCTIVHVWY